MLFMTSRFGSYCVKCRRIIINIISILQYNHEYTYTDQRYILKSVIKLKWKHFVIVKYSCSHIFCHHEIFLSPQGAQFLWHYEKRALHTIILTRNVDILKTLEKWQGLRLNHFQNYNKKKLSRNIESQKCKKH